MDKKVVFVIRASRRLGRAISIHFAENDCIVIANYNRSKKEVK